MPNLCQKYARFQPETLINSNFCQKTYNTLSTELLPDIVLRSNILYTPFRSKIKSAVRIPLGFGRRSTNYGPRNKKKSQKYY